MTKKSLLMTVLLLTGCSAWNDEFEGPVERAMPHASMHKIATMTGKGLLDEKDETISMSGNMNTKTFRDGKICRGREDVRRVFLMTWEDAEGTLHAGHHMYIIAKPSEWVVK
jgi:hypothetical protein